MSREQIYHVAGHYHVASRVDVTHEPTYPGDKAVFETVEWEVWKNAMQDERGNWTYDGILENYDTEADAVAAARSLAERDSRP